MYEDMKKCDSNFFKLLFQRISIGYALGISHTSVTIQCISKGGVAPTTPPALLVWLLYLNIYVNMLKFCMVLVISI